MHTEEELRGLIGEVTGAAAASGGDPLDPAILAKRTVLGLDHAVVASAPIAIYAVDLNGRVITWNHRAEQLFGWRADEVVGRIIPVVPAEGVHNSLDGVARMLAGEVFESHEARLVRRDGSPVDVVVSASLIHDEGEPVAIISFAVDVSEEREAHRRLATSENRWRTLLENISDTVTVTDEHGHVRQTTGEFMDVLGFDSAAWVGVDVFSLIRPEEQGEARAVFAQILDHPGEIFVREFRMFDQNRQSWETIEVCGVNALQNPAVEGVVFTTRNVTQQRVARQLIKDEAEVLELIARGASLGKVLQAVADLVASHSDGLVIIGPYGRWHQESGIEQVICSSLADLPDGFLDAVNDERHEPFFRRDENRYRGMATIAHLEHWVDRNPVAAVLVAAGYRSCVAARIADAGSAEVLGSIAVCHTSQRSRGEHEGNVLSVACQLAAVAIERYRREQELNHQAHHDQLTGLPNRRLVMEVLDRALADTSSAGPVGVMLLDLDRFKVVNDSLGHSVGDRLLAAFADRLTKIVRPGDVVGRFEGDEFVVVMLDVTDINDVRSIANRLDLALSEPFETEHGDLVLSASMGTALSTGVESPDDLLKHADAAVFRAKDLGGDRLEVFGAELRASADRRLALERDLRQAIERSELVLHYQPEIDLASGRVVGFEALLRWQHPERGLVLPSEFIGLSEETGLIVRIGRWVLAEAVHQVRTIADRMPEREPLVVSVNLSARQLSAPGFVRSVQGVLRTYDWPAELLQLELTESLLIDDTDARLEILQQLHDLGVKLAIDDFGTGFSSLSYLHRFPVDVIKIDRTFVEPLRADGSGSVVAKAVVHLAHDLGLLVTAEGVETVEQLAGLRKVGCDWAQGFHFAKAIASEELTDLLHRHPNW